MQGHFSRLSMNDIKSGILSLGPSASLLAVLAVFSHAPFARAQSLPLPASAASVDVPAREAGYYLHHFVYDAPATKPPQRVFVGGDFNLWSPTANPMRSDDAGHL